MLISLDSGLTSTMAIIGLKAFPGGAGRRARQSRRRAGRRADHRRRRGAADSLRRSAAVRRGAVPGADRHADRAAVGPVRHARGARPCLGRPRASGYFRTGYAQDLALVQTRAERIGLAAFLSWSCWLSVHRLALSARSRLPGVPRLDRRAVADAAHRLCRADLARPCRACSPPAPSPPAFCSRNSRAVLADAAGGGRDRDRARRRLRPAVAAAARALSRGQHAGAAFRRRLSRRRIRDQARLLDRHPRSIRRALPASS